MNRPLKIYFDGGCRPNPGKIEVAVVARGSTYFHDDLGLGTNTEAEWWALLVAAEFAAAHGAARCILVGDAQAVIDQANGVTKCSSARADELKRAYLKIVADNPGLRLRWLRRTQNLAGIALSARRALPDIALQSAAEPNS